MKYLLTLFLVALTLQPPALQACAMDDEKPTTHHAAMQDHGDAGCCQADNHTPVEGCDKSAHCALFSLSLLVIPDASGIPATPAEHHYDLLENNPYSGPTARRLLRPPIA